MELPPIGMGRAVITVVLLLDPATGVFVFRFLFPETLTLSRR